jgi:DNA-binding winged helix-turn-helix (wHTH) protein
MTLRFGEFRFDPASRQLLRGDDEVHLPPRLFKLLQVLLEKRPQAVSKHDLMKSVWPDVAIEEGNLKTIVSQLRDALGDADRPAPFIRTVHRFGYAFRGDVTIASPIAGAAAWQLSMNDQTRFVVRGAEAVIGRDPACEVWIDSGEVSRRHARLRIDGSTVVIEDLGSKNGTLVAGRRIDQPAELQDGQSFALGTLELTIRRLRADQSTDSIGGRTPARH